MDVCVCVVLFSDPFMHAQHSRRILREPIVAEQLVEGGLQLQLGVEQAHAAGVERAREAGA